MKDITKKYSNGEVTIVWKPSRCVHSTICSKESTGLPADFDPRRKPWVDPLGASTEAIVQQVRKCPSGALTCFMNQESSE